MTDLRKAAEMAFTELCNQRDAHYTKDIPTELTQAIQALREALAQPKREWVGLTDEEIDAVVKSCNTLDTYKYFRAIEAKLKEKNG